MEHIREPARDISVRCEVDVLVCGGGCAGAVAALAAAREGAVVAVVEQYGFLGGANTAAQVNGVGGWQYDLDGHPLISGIPLALMKRICAMEGSTDYVDRLATPVAKPNYGDGGLGCYWIRTNPEHTKLVLDRLLREEGVYVLLHAGAVMPIMDSRRVTGAFIESKDGREAILAGVTVDCTGDGDIAARAGADFQVGRPQDGACQPMSLIFTAGNARVPRLWYGDPADDPETHPLRKNRFAGAINLARERGEFRLNPNDLFCAAGQLDPGDACVRAVNFTRVQMRLSTDADELTQAEIEGRDQVEEAVRFMRGYMPGCENAYLVSSAPQIGIRESRRITGDHILTEDEIRNGADFDDVIARGIYLLDIHNPTEYGAPSVLKLLDAPYSIPYRSLVPRGLDGLLVAGRCISGDHMALASYRVQSHAMAIGQAAGVAAALSAAHGQSPRALDIELLHRRLLAAGVNLGKRFR
jgi:hypothetical protein